MIKSGQVTLEWPVFVSNCQACSNNHGWYTMKQDVMRCKQVASGWKRFQILTRLNLNSVGDWKTKMWDGNLANSVWYLAESSSQMELRRNDWNVHWSHLVSHSVWWMWHFCLPKSTKVEVLEPSRNLLNIFYSFSTRLEWSRWVDK